MSEEQETPAYKRCPRCRQIYPANRNFCVHDRSPLAPDARIIVGKYILVRKLGTGSMSEVHLADQPALGRQVAVKLLHRDPSLQRRFDTEVQAIGRIRHDHVVTIHDSGRTDDGRPYLAMEYLEGENLATHITQHGPLPGERAMVLWRQAVSAIAAAHRLQIVHRDIKPANVILTHKEGDEGPEEIVKVIDFSIAKMTPQGPTIDGEPTTNPGSVVGTMLYMAPEQLKTGKASTASDVYSLGLLLIEMLTGRLPFAAGVSDPAGVDAALRRLVLSPSRLRDTTQKPPSEELMQLAGAVLHPDPEQRPPDAGELLRRIKKLPEMRFWQRLPRKLPASRTSFSDLSWLKYSPPSEPAAAQPATAQQPTATVTSAAATADGVEDPAWSQEVKPWLNLQDDWGEPTLPAEALTTGEQKLQATLVSLSAEMATAKAEEPTKPTDEDEMSDAISSLPTTEVEPPTRPGTPPIESEDFETVQDKPVPKEPEPAAPLPSKESPLASYSGPTAIAVHKSKSRDGSHTLIWATSCVAAGLLLLLIVRVVSHTPQAPVKPPAPVVEKETAPVVTTKENAVPAPAPAPAEARAELGATANVAKTPAAAAPTSDEEEPTIRVRFYFDSGDDVSELTCGPRTLYAKGDSDKKKLSFELEMTSGETCKAMNGAGTRTKVYRYEQLAEKRADHAGFRRVHIKLKAKSTGDAEAADPKESKDVKDPPKESPKESPKGESQG